jgi:hypothetical protein
LPDSQIDALNIPTESEYFLCLGESRRIGGSRSYKMKAGTMEYPVILQYYQNRSIISYYYKNP